MKKLIAALMILTALFFTLVPDAMVWCKRMLLDTPTTHKIQTGEYLSKISQQYYGTAKYWQELALINRAPDSDLVFPGEEIFIPSQQVIEQLHRARSLSRVNLLMTRENELYAKLNATEAEPSQEVAQPAATRKSEQLISEAVADSNVIAKVTVPENVTDETEASSNGMLLAGIGFGILLLGLVVFLVIRKLKEARDRKALNELKTVTVDMDEDDEEPNYEEYRKNRSERLYV